MNIEKTKLKNKLETLFIDSPGAKSGSVQMWFRAGSALENHSNEGIAHFLEHMFFKGTPKRPGAKIAEDIESFGGEVNAFTSFDYTCYYINCPAPNLLESADILLDMVSNPMFNEEDITPERGVVFEEYRRSLDNPSQYKFFQIQKNSFCHGYAHPILGREETIKSFSKEQLVEFRNSFYNLSNAMLVVSGDLTKKDELTKLVEEYSMPDGKTSKFSSFKLKDKDTIDVHHKEVRQTTLTITIEAPPFLEKGSSEEDLAINCLGFGDTSRMTKELVLENSTASSCSASTMFFNHGGSHFIRLNFPHKNLSQVLKQLQKIIAEALKKGFKEKEVQKIKNQYLASKIYEKESLESFAFSLGHGFAQTGDIHCEEEFIKQIKAANALDVNNSLHDVFKRPLHLSLQIPKDKDIASSQKELESFISKMKKGLPKKAAAKKEKGVVTTDLDPKVKLIQLKPGIKLIYRQNEMTPTFVLHTYLKGGLSHETKSTNGLYHLISQLLNKGYGKLDYENLKMSLEERSVSMSGFSGKNAYGMTMHGQTQDAELLFKHFYGSLLSPKFPTKYLKHEKELVKRELDNHKEDPVKQCFKKFNSYIFNGHPYSLVSIGTNESMKKINLKKIKETHQKNIKNNEMVITYCGDLELSVVKDLLAPYLDKLSPRKEKKNTRKPPKPILGKNESIFFDREQIQVFIGTKAFKLGHKGELFLKMLTTHLSGQSSELFVEVRDRQGLCYAVQPVNFNALEAGYWGIYIGCGHDKLDTSIKAIQEILNKIKDNGLSHEQVETIKKMIVGQSFINIQTNEDYASIYSVPALHGLKLDYQLRAIQNINDVSADDFNKFVKKFLNQKWNIIKAGKVD